MPYYEPKQFLRGFIYSESAKKVYINTTGDVELPATENLTSASFSSQSQNAFSFNFNIQCLLQANTNGSWDNNVPIMENIHYQNNPTTTQEKIDDIRDQISKLLETHHAAFFIITAIVTNHNGTESKSGSNTMSSSSTVSIED